MPIDSAVGRRACPAVCGNKDVVLPMNSDAEAWRKRPRVARKWGKPTSTASRGRHDIIILANNNFLRQPGVVSFSQTRLQARRRTFLTLGFRFAYRLAMLWHRRIIDDTVADLLEPIPR